MAKKNPGKIFEEDFKKSCQDQKIFFHRIKDMKVPWDLPEWVKKKIIMPRNEYDSFIFANGHLFPLELKSLDSKSISFSESIIKQHQLDNLEKATDYNGVIPGLILNFRKDENRAFFIHITDFLNYKYIAENDHDNHPYKSVKKINQKSIPIAVAEEIGVEIPNVKKKVRFRYYVNEMVDKAIDKFKGYI